MPKWLERQLNSIVFPGIFPTYSFDYADQNRGIRILSFQSQDEQKVPYLQMKVNHEKKCLIYFHGNAEDIRSCVDFLSELQKKIHLNIYAMQYPGYGAYNSEVVKKSERIKSDAIRFFDLLQKDYKDEIIVFGRSIGTGPAAYLASQKNVKNLILMSPFTSILKIAQDIINWSIMGKIFNQYFDNVAALKKYKGRLLIIHGKKDEVINYQHGKQLYNQYRKSNKEGCYMVIPEYMTHNNFDMSENILAPIKRFLEQL